MKKVFSILTITLLLYMFTIPSQACTSFAVYSKNVYYGMNFDYPDVNFRFNITRNGSSKIFYGEMEWEKGVYKQVAGMNSNGLFSSSQIMLPTKASVFIPGEKTVNMPELTFEGLRNFNEVKDIKKYLRDKKLINMYVNYSYHDIFADKKGNAFIAEVGEKENKIIDMKDRFIVMTNFPNNDYLGNDSSEVGGAGDDRYKIANEYILSKKDNFSLNDGLEVLKKTVQGKEGGWPTQCSMLFDPQKNEVYVILKSDFSKVWKASIDKGTVETFSGFKEFTKLESDYNGITLEEMTNPKKTSSFNWQMILLSVISVSVIIVFFISRYLRGKKHAKKFYW